MLHTEEATIDIRRLWSIVPMPSAPAPVTAAVRPIEAAKVPTSSNPLPREGGIDLPKGPKMGGRPPKGGAPSIDPKQAFGRAIEGLDALATVQIGGGGKEAVATSVVAGKTMLETSMLMQAGRSKLVDQTSISREFDANLTSTATQLAFLGGQLAGGAPMLAGKEERVPLTALAKGAIEKARATSELALEVLDKAARDAKPGTFNGYL
jgi:hypothetical protein